MAGIEQSQGGEGEESRDQKKQNVAPLMAEEAAPEDDQV